MIGLMLLAFPAQPAFADIVSSKQTMFSGMNVYAPTVLLERGVYKMWYGGWQTSSDYPNDKIYYRTSSDNVNWSSPVPVLTPPQVHLGAQHINDPSVVRVQDGKTGSRYFMFYTVCMSPCAQSDNQIWSAVSTDGVAWSDHRPLLATAYGPAEPSVIADGNGKTFRVYYAERLRDCNVVRMATFDRSFALKSTTNVFTLNMPNCLTGPEVRYFNNSWHLFYNVWFSSEADPTVVGRASIYESESSSNTAWQSFSELISTPDDTSCGAITPGVLSTGGAEYDLYFGRTPTNGTPYCDVSHQESVERWRWIDD